MSSPTYFVYILRCADGTYYVGQTDDLTNRVAIHQSGHGPRYTAIRPPIELIYHESFPSRSEALARESQIKRWSKSKKEALISGDIALLHRLAKRKSPPSRKCENPVNDPEPRRREQAQRIEGPEILSKRSASKEPNLHESNRHLQR